MTWTNRVVWQEGMFLRAQHFQQQDRWLEMLVRTRAAALRPHSWGVIEMSIDRDLLSTGRFALSSAVGVFEAYDTHPASPQPAPLLIGRLRLRYMLESEERAGYLCIGLARVTEVASDRRATLDERWIPPALVCSAALPLSGLVTEFSGML